MAADIEQGNSLRTGWGKGISPAEKYLCSLLGEEVTAAVVAQALGELGDAELFALARCNRVAPIVAHRLLDRWGRDAVSAHWRQAHEETYHRISAYMAELDRVADLLAAQGVPVVALKNSGIARGIYACPGCSPMGDLDLLVEKRHLQIVHRVLTEDGYTYGARNVMEQAYHKVLPGDIPLWLEVLWRSVDGRWIRPEQEPPTEEVMARSRPIPGTAARVLAPEDNLLQVALHTAKHSFVRAPGFRLHLDVDRIVRHQEIDWDTFTSRVSVLQVRTPVYFSLVLPAVLFNTPIPDRVLKGLAPPAWKKRLLGHWLQEVGLFCPDERKFGNAGFLIFHALLYDDLAGVLRSLFPAAGWMKEQFGFRSSALLPYYTIRRLGDLMFRRTL